MHIITVCSSNKNSIQSDKNKTTIVRFNWDEKYREWINAHKSSFCHLIGRSAFLIDQCVFTKWVFTKVICIRKTQYLYNLFSWNHCSMSSGAYREFHICSFIHEFPNSGGIPLHHAPVNSISVRAQATSEWSYRPSRMPQTVYRKELRRHLPTQDSSLTFLHMVLAHRKKPAAKVR